MRELDEAPRSKSAPCLGYEDMRLFWARKPRRSPGEASSPNQPGQADEEGELQGIACALMLNIKHNGGVAEQVLLRFDESYNIIAATPLRGAWSMRAQKNWMPFDARGLPSSGSATPKGGAVRSTEVMNRASCIRSTKG